jgi:outer membrane protein OmpA-like peptidoglycan-associated protein
MRSMSRLVALLIAFFAGAACAQPVADARWSSYRDFWFDYDSAQIDKSDDDKIADVANYARQNPTYRLAIDAVMDADGALSRRRVDAIRAALVHAGVPGYKIQEGTFGGERLRRSRRVEVLVDRRD